MSRCSSVLSFAIVWQTEPSRSRTACGRGRRSRSAASTGADPWTIEVDDIELLPFSSITDEDLARTGEDDVEALRRRAAHAGPIGDDTLLYRVEFHVVREPDDDDR